MNSNDTAKTNLTAKEKSTLHHLFILVPFLLAGFLAGIFVNARLGVFFMVFSVLGYGVLSLLGKLSREISKE